LNPRFQKWKIYEVITPSQGYVESICFRGVIGSLTRTQDKVWDFFEKLTWDTYMFEQFKEIMG